MRSGEGVSDPVELIAEGREKLATEDRGGWANAALSDRMVSVGGEWERLGAVYLGITSEWDARGAWAEDGFVSAKSWLTAHGNMTRPAAGRFLRSARHCSRFERTSECNHFAQTVNPRVEELEKLAKDTSKPETYAKLARGYEALIKEVEPLAIARGKAAPDVKTYVEVLRQTVKSCRDLEAALRAGGRVDGPERELERVARREKSVAAKLVAYCSEP